MKIHIFLQLWTLFDWLYSNWIDDLTDLIWPDFKICSFLIYTLEFSLKNRSRVEVVVQFFPQKIERINGPTRHVLLQNIVDQRYIVWYSAVINTYRCLAHRGLVKLSPNVMVLCETQKSTWSIFFILWDLLYTCNLFLEICIYKNIVRHTAHTIVSWPNPKQWLMIHTSGLMMIIR